MLRNPAQKQAQMALNAASWLNGYGVDPPAPLLTKADRVIYPLTAAIRQLCEELEAKGLLLRWDAVKNHGVTALRGWREARATYALQAIEHSTSVIELDFDVFNPGFGLGPVLLHGLAEVAYHKLFRKKTDPFLVARKRGFPITKA